MRFNDAVEKVSTFVDLKRFANEYVIDYKRLSFEELKAACKKTAPQYSNESNISSVVSFFELNPNRDMRILFSIIVKSVLLNCDDFTEDQKIVEDRVLEYEQGIVDLANEYSLESDVNDVDFYRYVVEAAWDNNDAVSVDEQNLINKIRAKLNISDKHHQILEAQIGRFPTTNNVLHTRSEIAAARRLLQVKGILIPVRDSNNTDYDVIPDEVAASLRSIFNIDIKVSSFYSLLESKYVKSKKYLYDMLQKANVSVPSNANLSQLKDLVVERMNAHQLLNGFSANDGLDKTTLSEWCSTLELTSYGNKPDLTNRIIAYYDEIKQIKVSEDDEREVFFQFFNELASRNLPLLHQQGVISKDLECEHKFEIATNYIFEKIFKIKPLIMSGSEHPDGMVSYNDKLIMWDNKSKETPVSLADHIKQFDRYIKTSAKPVSVFMVIGPSFTPDSAKECAKYALTSDTIILLITAEELKNVAMQFAAAHQADNDPLPLGIFKQNGRFDPDLIVL